MIDETDEKRGKKMSNNMFRGIFDTSTTQVIPVSDFLLCVVVALIIGAVIAAMYAYKSKYTQSFVITLALLPAVVCVVIMMVNGNVGTGVAVAGAFSLVRFRSVPGTAKEIGAIFLAMGAGLITGMGYLAYAVLFAVVVGGMMCLYTQIGESRERKQGVAKTLRITIPENMDYTGAFDDLMETFTRKNELIDVKTTNMGSLFKLTYRVVLKDITQEKTFIDALRCRNGNLEIVMAKEQTGVCEL